MQISNATFQMFQQMGKTQRADNQPKQLLPKTLQQTSVPREDTVSPELQAKIDALLHPELQAKTEEPGRKKFNDISPHEFMTQVVDFRQSHIEKMEDYRNQYAKGVEAVKICKDALNGNSDVLATMQFSVEERRAFLDSNGGIDVLSEKDLSLEETALAYQFYGDRFLNARVDAQEKNLTWIQKRAVGESEANQLQLRAMQIVFEYDYGAISNKVKYATFIPDSDCFANSDSENFLENITKAIEQYKNHYGQMQSIAKDSYGID